MSRQWSNHQGLQPGRQGLEPGRAEEENAAREEPRGQESGHSGVKEKMEPQDEGKPRNCCQGLHSRSTAGEQLPQWWERVPNTAGKCAKWKEGLMDTMNIHIHIPYGLTIGNATGLYDMC